MARVEIIGVRPCSNWGTVKAFVSICIDDEIIVNECRVLEKGGKVWVSMPSRPDTDEYGVKRYHSLIEFRDQDLAREVFNTIAEYWRESTRTE